jgi:hypothetical protein
VISLVVLLFLLLVVASVRSLRRPLDDVLETAGTAFAAAV